MINSEEIRQKRVVRPYYANLYAYAANNPVKYVDPDGRTINSPVGKYDRDVNLTRKEVNQIKAQEQQRAKEAALERYNEHH